MYFAWESIDTDDGPRTMDHGRQRQTHFKSLLLPDSNYSDAASYTLENIEQDIKYPLGSLYGFESSFANGDSEKLNTQIHFNTDSIFFVCDNSTTGHIRNDIQKFVPGTLR